MVFWRFLSKSERAWERKVKIRDNFWRTRPRAIGFLKKGQIFWCFCMGKVEDFHRRFHMVFGRFWPIKTPRFFRFLANHRRISMPFFAVFGCFLMFFEVFFSIPMGIYREILIYRGVFSCFYPEIVSSH